MLEPAPFITDYIVLTVLQVRPHPASFRVTDCGTGGLNPSVFPPLTSILNPCRCRSPPSKGP